MARTDVPPDFQPPLLAEVLAEPVQELQLESKPLRGGLEASEVALLTARYRDGRGRARLRRFVIKRLEGSAVREATVHEHLAARFAAGASPRLLAVDRAADGRATMYLEALSRTRAWPWRDITVAQQLLRRLAHFHRAAQDAAAALPEWDFEAELRSSALATLEAVDRCRRDAELSRFGQRFPALKRVVLAREAMRRQLLAERPFGSGPIHGDVHPGNAIVCRRGRGDEPMLIDWGRARIGSPLEDVNSWLQSLGFWEPEARRSHDRMLATYLSARGLEQASLSSVRPPYWFAGASNALSGALLHHLTIARDQRQSAARRSAAARAADDWLRVIRRADAWWS